MANMDPSMSAQMFEQVRFREEVDVEEERERAADGHEPHTHTHSGAWLLSEA